MGAHRKRKWLVLAALLAGLTILGAYHITASRRALRGYRALLVAQGEKLDLNSLIPSPSAAGGEAAARLFAATAALPASPQTSPDIAPRPMRRVAPGKAEVGWARADVFDEDGPVSWELISEKCQRYRAELAAAARAMEVDDLNWNLNYRAGFALSLPHLQVIRKSAQWLTADTMVALHEQRFDEAVGRIRSLLAFVKADRDDRLMVGQITRLSIASMVLSLNWELLQTDGSSDAALADLQKRWASLEFIDALGRSIEMERAMILDFFAQARQDPAHFRQMLGITGTGPGGAPVPPAPNAEFTEALATWTRTMAAGTATSGFASVWGKFWSHGDELYYLQETQAELDAGRRSARGSGALPYFGPGQPERTPSVRHVISSMMLPSRGRIFSRAIRIQTERDMLLATIGLRRCQIRHARLPERLEELTPELLDRLPTDWVNGQPLRYRRLAENRYLLYSVGEDGVDSDGDSRPPPGSRSHTLTRDWVWPEPATAEEVAEADRRERRPTPAIRTP